MDTEHSIQWKQLHAGGAGPAVSAGTSVLIAVTVVFVVLRGIYASKLAGRWRWDFIWVATATFFGIVAAIIWNLSTAFGSGLDIDQVPLPDLFVALRYIWLGILFGLVAFAAAKASIFALYLQVCTPQQKIQRVVLHFINTLYILTCLGQFILILVQCNPTDKLWNLTKPGTCNLQMVAEKYSYYYGAMGVFVDLFLALYPTTIVWNMQAPLKIKLGFCALMAGGLITVIAAAVRIYYTQRLYVTTNATRAIEPFLVAGSVECWLIILLGCIPPLRPQFLKVMNKVKTRVTGFTSSHMSSVGGTHGGRKPGSRGTPHISTLGTGTKFGGSQLDTVRLGGIQKGMVSSVTFGDDDEKELVYPSKPYRPEAYELA